MARHRHAHGHSAKHQVSAVAPFPRTARVNQVLREVIADEIERRSGTDERLDLATVTGVEVGVDLRKATVYMSHLSETLAQALAEERIAIQREIGRQVRLKRTPHLEFVADPAISGAQRVEEILRRLRREGSGGLEPSETTATVGGSEAEHDDAVGKEGE